MTGHPYPLDYVNGIALVTVVILQREDRLITVKHEIPAWTERGNPWIPGQTLKIGQIPGLSRAALDSWQLCLLNETFPVTVL